MSYNPSQSAATQALAMKVTRRICGNALEKALGYTGL